MNILCQPAVMTGEKHKRPFKCNAVRREVGRLGRGPLQLDQEDRRGSVPSLQPSDVLRQQQQDFRGL